MGGAVRYSRWDGTQGAVPLEPSDLIASLADRLIRLGEVVPALRDWLAAPDEPWSDARGDAELVELLRGRADRARLGVAGTLPDPARPAAGDGPAGPAFSADRPAAGRAPGFPVGGPPDPRGELDRMLDALVDAGLVRVADGVPVLSPAGVRRVGQAALREVFAVVPPGRSGAHPDGRSGPGPEDGESARAWEFGDRFQVDLLETMRQALRRGERGPRLGLVPSDFRVRPPGGGAAAATVLLVDLSASMAQRGCLAAAKKIALAVHALVREAHPRDALHVVGFATQASELTIEELLRLGPGVLAEGTNLQAGLGAARALLRRHPAAARQILLVTDGEPTAHSAPDGRVRVSYPPSRATVRATLAELARCTRDRITVNTFMLDRGAPLVAFVGHMTRLNRGRAFLADPARLGRYAVVDFVRHGQKKLP